MDKGKISVIIPAYNVRDYIRQCVESIIEQSYQNLEIMIVDDGSTDGTAQVIDKLRKEDTRIKVITLKNGGVSNARNKGIETATGEYITFADADDTLEPDMYELLIKTALEYNADIAHCGYNRVDKDGVKPITGTGKKYVQSRDDALSCLLTGKLYVGSLWNKLYKTELFHNVRLDTALKINEDVLANYCLFLNAEKTVFVDLAKYNYIVRYETSSCEHTGKIKKAEDCLTAAKRILEKTPADETLKRLARIRYANLLKETYKTYILTKDATDKNRKKELYSMLCEACAQGSIAGGIKRAEISIMHTAPFAYRLIYKVYDKIRVPNWDI